MGTRISVMTPDSPDSSYSIRALVNMDSGGKIAVEIFEDRNAESISVSDLETFLDAVRLIEKQGAFRGRSVSE